MYKVCLVCSLAGEVKRVESEGECWICGDYGSRYDTKLPVPNYETAAEAIDDWFTNYIER